MNLQSKFSQFSQKKTEGRCKTLQTLPSETQVDTHQYDSLFSHNHYLTSIKAYEPPVITCSSPTFANSQLLSLSQYRLNNNKQNHDENTNWKQEARMLKGANNKLEQSNKQLQKQNSYLRQMLESIKEEFKKKPQNSKVVRLLASFQNSSNNKDQIDIYLQFVHLTKLIQDSQTIMKKNNQDIQSITKRSKQLQLANQKLSSNIESLTKQNQQLKQKLSSNTKSLTKQNQQLKQKLNKKQSQYDELKQLKDQVDKQRQNVSKKVSELQANLNVANHSVSEFQKDHQTNFLELEKYKEQIEKCKEQLQKLSKQNQNLKKEKEHYKELLTEQKKLNENQQDQIQSIKQHNNNLERQVARGISQMEMIKKKSQREVSSAQQKIKNLQIEINQMKQNYQFEREQREMSEQKSQTIRANQKKIQSELSQLKEQKLSAQRSIFSKDQQIEQLKRKLSNLTMVQQKLLKDIQFYEEKMDILERDEKSLEEIKNYQIELKQEVIRKLIGFAPHQSKDVLEEYLIIIQELVTSQDESQNRKDKILIEVDHTILAHKDKIKNLEQVSRKYNELKYEYQLLKKSIANQTRRMDASLETNRRYKINKYFARQ